MDLAEFLAARLAEDEAAASDVHNERCSALDPPPGPFPCDCGWPARVLREVTAKRAILAEFEQAREIHGGTGKSGGLILGTLMITLKSLADIYIDHPDYPQAWKP